MPRQPQEVILCEYPGCNQEDDENIENSYNANTRRYMFVSISHEHGSYCICEDCGCRIYGLQSSGQEHLCPNCFNSRTYIVEDESDDNVIWITQHKLVETNRIKFIIDNSVNTEATIKINIPRKLLKGNIRDLHILGIIEEVGSIEDTGQWFDNNYYIYGRYNREHDGGDMEISYCENIPERLKSRLFRVQEYIYGVNLVESENAGIGISLKIREEHRDELIGFLKFLFIRR